MSSGSSAPASPLPLSQRRQLGTDHGGGPGASIVPLRPPLGGLLDYPALGVFHTRSRSFPSGEAPPLHLSSRRQSSESLAGLSSQGQEYFADVQLPPIRESLAVAPEEAPIFSGQKRDRDEDKAEPSGQEREQEQEQERGKKRQRLSVEEMLD